MKLKKIFNIFLILIFTVTALVSCGSPEETGGRLSEDRDISPELEYESRMSLVMPKNLPLTITVMAMRLFPYPTAAVF